MILVSELHQCETFWTYARKVSQSPGDQSVVREYARRYVPRAGPHGDQDLLAAIFLVAAEHHPERYYPWRGGRGQALRALVELAGPVAYFADDALAEGRLAGLPEPSDRRRIGTSGRAASLAQLASLKRGAELVRRRGAGTCLASGCEVEVGHDPYWRGGGGRRLPSRIDYCRDHDLGADHRGDLDAMRGVLIPAAYAWRARGSRSLTPISQEPARSPSVVTRIKAGLEDLSDSSEWQVERELVLERGLLAEAA